MSTSDWLVFARQEKMIVRAVEVTLQLLVYIVECRLSRDSRAKGCLSRAPPVF